MDNGILSLQKDRDGEQTRNLIHVSDTVRGTELTAENDLAGVYNLSTGENYSLNTVVETLNDELGTAGESEHLEKSIPEDIYVRDTCTNVAKTKDEAVWVFDIDIKQGIRRVCTQYQGPPQG